MDAEMLNVIRDKGVEANNEGLWDDHMFERWRREWDSTLALDNKRGYGLSR